MMRNLARDIARIAAAEVLPMLRLAKKSAKLPVHRRDLLQRAVNRLHHACRLVEEGRGSEEHDDLYLPLFDTLALTTDAINQPHQVDKYIDLALTELKAIANSTSKEEADTIEA